MGRPGAGRRGQVQPAGAAPSLPDQQEDGGKGGYRERVDDSGDEPDGAAAGNEETVDVPRHRHAAVGRDEWQPGHRRQVGQRQEDKSLGDMLEELREGSQEYKNYGGG